MALVDVPGTALPAGPVAGELTEAHSHDVYSVELAQGVQLLLTLSPGAGASGDQDYDVRLFAPGTTTIASDPPSAVSDAPSYPETMDFVTPAAGTYYIDVARTQGSGGYRLEHEVVATPVNEDQLLQNPAIENLTSVHDTSDVFPVYLDVGERIKLTLNGSDAFPGQDFNLYLRDAGSSYTWASSENEAYADTIDFTSTNGHWYDVVVTAEDGAGTYSLGWEYLPTPDLNGYGSVSGKVIGSDGKPLGGVMVTASDGTFIKSTFTKPDGNYCMYLVKAGTHTIFFSPQRLGQYYMTVEFGTPVIVANRANTPGVNATIQLGGWITGTVTAKDRYSGLVGPIFPAITVYAYDAMTGAERGHAATSGGGWGIADLPAGEYIIKFDVTSNTYLDEYWDDADSMTTAQHVTVVAGTTAEDINAHLALNTQLTGVVSGGGWLLPNVIVNARDTDTGLIAGTARTDSDGRYRIADLPLDEYKLEFDPSDLNASWDSDFLAEYYGSGQATYESAFIIPINNAGEAMADYGIDLRSTTYISGVVTGQDGPAPEIDVCVHDADTGEDMGYAYTLEDGSYRIDGLAPGRYTVEFIVPDWYAEYYGSYYLGEYYNNSAGQTGATEIVLSRGDRLTELDADLESYIPSTPVAVYRFYRPSTGTHFYTADYAEMVDVRDHMSSTYTLDGIGYYTNTSNPANSVPLYRFYNERTGTHLYTADEDEAYNIIDNLYDIYSLDGVAYYVSMSSGLQVHRFYNPSKGVHFYSADPNEIAYVRANLGATWRYEGPAYCVAQ